MQRHGYESLDAVRAEGEAKGKAEGQLETLRGAILDLFTVRGLSANEEVRAAIAACRDVALLKRWHRRAAVAAETIDMLSAEPE